MKEASGADVAQPRILSELTDRGSSIERRAQRVLSVSLKDGHGRADLFVKVCV